MQGRHPSLDQLSRSVQRDVGVIAGIVEVPVDPLVGCECWRRVAAMFAGSSAARSRLRDAHQVPRGVLISVVPGGVARQLWLTL